MGSTKSQGKKPKASDPLDPSSGACEKKKPDKEEEARLQWERPICLPSFQRGMGVSGDPNDSVQVQRSSETTSGNGRRTSQIGERTIGNGVPVGAREMVSGSFGTPARKIVSPLD